MKIDLVYGMAIVFPSKPISVFSKRLGIAITNSDTPTENIEMVVSKYWESDTDANKYKVKLIPTDENKSRFGNENLYSSDLKSLINQGVCSIKTEV